MDIKMMPANIKRSYTMSNEEKIREILVQDVKFDGEVDRFGNLVYRRQESIDGKPLYFAPYFTQDSKETTGIGSIARILHIAPEKISVDWNDVKDECTKFAELAHPEDREMVETLLGKWEKGVVEHGEDKNKALTYYFLDEPVLLKTPLLKNPPKDSKGWLGGMIPANRCVTFDVFLKKSDLVK